MSSQLAPAAQQNKSKLLDQVRQLMRLRHYSLRTEEAYVGWIRRYILFHRKRHPTELREEDCFEVFEQLGRRGQSGRVDSKSSVERVAVSLQRSPAPRARLHRRRGAGKTRAQLPVVLSRAEVRAVVAQLSGQYRLMAQLLYGSGLRLLECLRLRVKDVDLGYLHIIVRDPKGGKERRTMLPVSLGSALREHLQKVKQLHEQDVREEFGRVYLPNALERKLPSASREWSWQYVFPADRRSIDPRSGTERRHL